MAHAAPEGRVAADALGAALDKAVAGGVDLGEPADRYRAEAVAVVADHGHGPGEVVLLEEDADGRRLTPCSGLGKGWAYPDFTDTFTVVMTATERCPDASAAELLAQAEVLDQLERFEPAAFVAAQWATGPQYEPSGPRLRATSGQTTDLSRPIASPIRA